MCGGNLSEYGLADFDVACVMKSLSAEKRIFTSEADFQFSLAWKIKEMYPEFDVRLEETLLSDPDKHIDIVLHHLDAIIPIELKYCTRSLKPSESFNVVLKNQGAQDLRRYDFIKDVQRIESIRDGIRGSTGTSFIRGYAIILTNSSSYWDSNRDYSGCCDRDFRIDGKKESFGGLMEWRGASDGTMKGREKPLRTGVYKIHWENYLDDPLFRYLMVRIV